MTARERKLARKKLDMEMQPYRKAGKQENPTNELMRAVRQALRVPVKEICGKMGVCRSVLLRLEASERKKAITLRSLARMAGAMGCKVVYGVVPEDGKTLEELAEERLWRSLLGRKGSRDPAVLAEAGRGAGTREGLEARG